MDHERRSIRWMKERIVNGRRITGQADV
jgi:hypothetical protein